jgi:hypothetical protein
MLSLKNETRIFRNFPKGHDLSIEITTINYIGIWNSEFGALMSHSESTEAREKS